MYDGVQLLWFVVLLVLTPSAKMEMVETIEEPVSPIPSPTLDKWRGIMRRRLDPHRADLIILSCLLLFFSDNIQMHFFKSALISSYCMLQDLIYFIVLIKGRLC